MGLDSTYNPFTGKFDMVSDGSFPIITATGSGRSIFNEGVIINESGADSDTRVEWDGGNAVIMDGATGNWDFQAGNITTTGTARAGKYEVDNASTYIDKDGSGNMTFTDSVTGTRTLKTIGCPVYHYIKATGQSAGNLHLSDATNWGVNKTIIKTIRVVTSSTYWDMWLLQNDNGYVTNDANIPKKLIMRNGNSSADIFLDLPFEDEDASNEVHIYWFDYDGGNTADIYILGMELV